MTTNALIKQLRDDLNNCLKEKSKILSRHYMDKKYYRNIIKIMMIALGISISLNIMILLYGRDAIDKLLQIINIFK